MLKNWVVKTSQIKKKDSGFINHVNYLTDKNRASHFYSDITVLADNAKNIIKAVDDRQNYRKSRSLRGGGIRNYCTSFILTVPRDIKQPSVKDWEKILSLVYATIAKQIDLEPSVIEQHAFSVLHDESSSPDKNSHVHLLVSNVIHKKFQKKITQKAVTQAVKQALNLGVLLTVQEDNSQYKPSKKQKYNKPAFLVRQEKLLRIEQQLQQLKLTYKKAIESIKTWSTYYLRSLTSHSERYAADAAETINETEALSTSAASVLDTTVKALESSRQNMPNETKVSPKRKRRRRKNR